MFFERSPRGFRIGKNCTSILLMTRTGTAEYYIIESEMVVAKSNYSNSNYYFVPDEYVDAYKADSQWSSNAAKIYPISSFVQMFPNEPARMYEEW